MNFIKKKMDMPEKSLDYISTYLITAPFWSNSEIILHEYGFHVKNDQRHGDKIYVEYSFDQKYLWGRIRFNSFQGVWK